MGDRRMVIYHNDMGGKKHIDRRKSWTYSSYTSRLPIRILLDFQMNESMKIKTSVACLFARPQLMSLFMCIEWQNQITSR